MKKKIYNTPLTCADLLMVGMSQIMVDSTRKSANIETAGNSTGKLAPTRVGKIYI